jgi:hypothetical protein
MSGLPSISVDSLGNRTAHGLPPLTDRPGTPADRQALARWVQVAHRDPPAHATADPHQQARSFTHGAYIGLRTVMTALSGASLVVSRRAAAAVRKSQAASAAGPGESDWSPAPADSPPARLFDHINEVQTPAEFLSEYVMCFGLFGMAVTYFVPDRSGTPCELYNLRRNHLTTPQGLSEPYPRGHWLYAMPRPMLWGATGLLNIPREHTVVHKDPHPVYPWDGYSPLAAGGKFVDFLNSIIDSRQMAMDRGFTPDVLVKMAGASDAQIGQFMGHLKANYTGQNRGQRVLPVDADRVEVEYLNRTPEEMAYPEGYEQAVAAVLALYGVPKSAAMLNEASSYAAWYASARQFRESRLDPLAKGIGDKLTKELIRPHFGPDYRVEVKLPPVMDPDLKERQISTLLQADAIRVNELRASYDMPPLDDGDQTPREREAARQQQGQGAGGLVPKVGYDKNGRKFTRMVHPDEPPGGGDPLAGMGDPAAEPGASGELDSPDVGGAGAGSLPGQVRKAFSAEDFFGALVAEVLA